MEKLMKRLIALLALLPILALAQVTTNPGVTGVPAPQSAVAITGGTINGTPIGATTPSTGAFTTATFSSTVGVTGLATLTAGAVTGTGTTTALNSADIGLPNNKYFRGANAANTTQYALIGVDGSNVVQINANGATGGTNITGTYTVSAIASSGAAQSGYLCYNTAGGVITYDGGATCLVSREEYKTNLGPIQKALPTVMALRPFWGAYKEGTPMADHRVQPFLGARKTAKVDDRLASFDKEGEPLGVRYENMTAVLVAAIQEQQVQIKRLQREVKELQREQYAGRQSKARQAAYTVH